MAGSRLRFADFDLMSPHLFIQIQINLCLYDEFLIHYESNTWLIPLLYLNLASVISFFPSFYIYQLQYRLPHQTPELFHLEGLYNTIVTYFLRNLLVERSAKNRVSAWVWMNKWLRCWGSGNEGIWLSEEVDVEGSFGTANCTCGGASGGSLL